MSTPSRHCCTGDAAGEAGAVASADHCTVASDCAVVGAALGSDVGEVEVQAAKPAASTARIATRPRVRRRT
ncbi:MAG TPA: hypothetical protein VIU11_03490 [Nakamurella sp.]